MTNKNNYWAERARLDKIKVIKTGEKGIDNLKRLLKTNLDDVEKKIKEFYDKYGENPAENLSYAEFEKYKANLRAKAKKYPNDKTLQKLAKENIPKYKIDRLRALQTDLQIMLTEATKGQEAGIYKTLNDVGKVSQAVLASRLKKSIGLEFNTIASRKMKQLLSSDWSGASWSKRLWKDRELVGQKLTNILEKGIVQGTSLQKMSRELKQVTGQSFNNSFRLIRTETSYIDGQVKLEYYKKRQEEKGRKLKYKYDAFLDNRTSKICKELDNKTFWVDEAEVGKNFPPLHPNCRSTTQLILDEDEMQEPVKELTEFKDFKKFNRKAYELAKFSENAADNKKQALEFARKTYSKNTLNSFYNAGKLNTEQMKLLGAKTDNIKFSLDNMIKNRINHPEINFSEYKKIPDILNNPDKISLSKNKENSIIVFKKDDKYYQAVIKTTKDKKENFLTSFRRLNEKEYNKY